MDCRITFIVVSCLVLFASRLLKDEFEQSRNLKTKYRIFVLLFLAPLGFLTGSFILYTLVKYDFSIKNKEMDRCIVKHSMENYDLGLVNLKPFGLSYVELFNRDTDQWITCFPSNWSAEKDMSGRLSQVQPQ